MDELFVCLLFLAALFAVLAVGGLIADYVFPRIDPLERWIESLPMMNDEEGAK